MEDKQSLFNVKLNSQHPNRIQKVGSQSTVKIDDMKNMRESHMYNNSATSLTPLNNSFVPQAFCNSFRLHGKEKPLNQIR
jgi:hypothetical protein